MPLSSAPESLLSELFENNRHWVRTQTSRDASFFSSHSSSQHPRYFYVGCSDSRVPAESLLGLRPGEMFVFRSIANVARLADLSFSSVLDYALRVLECRYIIVCGHSNCGGIRACIGASLAGHGPLEAFLQPVQHLASKHRSQLMPMMTLEEKVAALTRLNVKAQCHAIRESEPVKLAQKKGRGYPKVIGLYYDLSTGLIESVQS